MRTLTGQLLLLVVDYCDCVRVGALGIAVAAWGTSVFEKTCATTQKTKKSCFWIFRKVKKT